MQITEYLNKRVFLIFLTVMLFFVSGCSKMPEGMLKQDAEQYTQEQIRLIAITERNRYQNIYTGQLWGVTADSNGNTFETLLKNQVRQFLEELAVVDRMAQEENISLTGQEEDDIKNLSSEFFQSLSNEDLNYLQITENDVLDLYRKYYLADKTVGQLTDTKNLEVSDAEAKVIQVERIETDSKDKAEALLSMVSEEKADFLAIAEKNSINSQIQYQIGWDTGLKEPDRSAFDLEENEISPIIEAGGHFFIQKCTNAYDQTATAERKSKLAQQKKTEAFRQIYEPYQQKYQIRLPADLWKNIDFSAGEGCSTDNFFTLYHSYFSN